MEDGTNGLEEHALPDAVDETVVIAQSGGERPTEFANRVIRRIEGLKRHQHGIAGAVLLLSPRFDAEATAARVSLSRMLMAHSAGARGPSALLLSAGGELDPALQAKVLALVDVMTGDASATALPIAVHFGSAGVSLGHHLSSQLSLRASGEVV